MHHRSLAWYTREEQSWSVWVNINIWTGKCSTSCAMISPLLFSFWARFCFCNWVLDKLNLQIWCLYGYMCIKGGGFWGFCDLTWGTKLYSGGDTTDFFFPFAQSFVLGILAMEIRMSYLKHDIVLIVVILAPVFCCIEAGVVYNWHNYFCILLNTGGDLNPDVGNSQLLLGGFWMVPNYFV